MASLTIGSLNCRGLANDTKRRDIFNRYRKKFDIIVLVDTHCTVDKEKQWLHEWGYKAHFSSHSGNSRGITILMNNTFKYEVHKELKDEGGNYLILDLTIQDYRLTFVALYGPNDDNPTFFNKIHTMVSSFQNSSIIMVGDWNVVQDFDMDTSNYKTKNNIKSHEKIIEMKHSLDLIDVWRANNPEKRRYTWRGPNLKQSRLDYFLVSSDFEPYLKKVDIDISYRSDHSPVYLNFQFCNQSKGKGTWKFNNSLLYDKEYVSIVKQCITETVNQYSLPGSEENIDLSINPHLFWEMLKCMIRGKTIAYSSHLKKSLKQTENDLYNQLQTLHSNFESHPTEELRQEIQNGEQKLIDHREKNINGIMARAKARWEAEGEKCTNYFCNLEKRHYNEKLISKLVLDNGKEISDQFEILKEQRSFYEKLYSSSNPDIGADHESLFFMKKTHL